ncbi:hypothetical protein [Promicromonospora sp. NPDC060271]|uniref:hypothetical protein n=1 Tax=Promicromonospora sp. NPDC060271 TaxID=3347089 RepID=UPI0036586234
MTNRPQRQPSRPRVAPALVLASILALTGALAGCGPAATRADDAGALGSVSDHLDDASSAVATAELAVRARAAGRLPAVTADAAVGDAVETATGAVHGIGTLVVAAEEAEQVREEALSAASAAVGPVAAARTWLGQPPSPADDVLRALDDASGGLDDASGAVEQAAARAEARASARTERTAP